MVYSWKNSNSKFELRHQLSSEPTSDWPENKEGKASGKRLQTISRSLESKSGGASNAAHLDVGLVGSFNVLENDFATRFNDERGASDLKRQHFEEEPHWTSEKRTAVKRFRFVICCLGLIASTLSIQSRLILNITIVEMTAKGKPDESLSSSMEQPPPLESVHQYNESTSNRTHQPELPPYASLEGDDDIIRFNWTLKDQNLLLSSFYVGYAPSMLLSGGIADRYGSRYPLLVGAIGTTAICALTPIVARYSLHLLIGLRILLGILQGGLIPSVYDLFNRWLTVSEMSIWVPLVKSSTAFGGLMGTLLPGVVVALGFHWPLVFFTTASLSAVFTLAWFILATSSPHENRFLKPDELQWIVRKKKKPLDMSVLVVNDKMANGHNAAEMADKVAAAPHPSQQTVTKIPWLLIMTHPSVIALTLVKFTYNFGMDFFCIELALYMNTIHHATTGMISAVLSCGSMMQMVLIMFVGWLAKVLVNREALGLSRTKWRKIFQGGANFGLAAIFFLLPLAGLRTWLVVSLVLVALFVWMLGAGGESMVPYDLSSRYPATIVGFAHSISIISGFTMPIVCSLIVGENSTDVRRWNRLFIVIGCVLTVGGLIFVLVVKAKAFLPGEKVEKSPPPSHKDFS